MAVDGLDGKIGEGLYSFGKDLKKSSELGIDPKTGKPIAESLSTGKTFSGSEPVNFVPEKDSAEFSKDALQALQDSNLTGRNVVTSVDQLPTNTQSLGLDGLPTLSNFTGDYVEELVTQKPRSLETSTFLLNRLSGEQQESEFQPVIPKPERVNMQGTRISVRDLDPILSAMSGGGFRFSQTTDVETDPLILSSSSSGIGNFSGNT
ncbi:hypothetical protein HOF92_12310, partial [bacterium]|nr:hypothetical protein [bacterium]